jgi:hypothetical protein
MPCPPGSELLGTACFRMVSGPFGVSPDAWARRITVDRRSGQKVFASRQIAEMRMSVRGSPPPSTSHQGRNQGVSRARGAVWP